LIEDGSPTSRLRAVVAGKRNLGQQVLEIVITGPITRDEAVTAMTNTLSSLIQIDRSK